MTRNQKILVACAIAAALLLAGKFSAVTILTALAPIYAWLLASVILLFFVVLAMIIVPIGQKIIDRRKTTAPATAENRRKAA